MKALQSFVARLAQPDVRSLVLTSGQRPKLVTLGGSETLDDHEVTNDHLLRFLFAAGGSRYLESLSAKPSTWTTRVDGVGNVRVSVVQRGVFIEAELSVPGREVHDRGPVPGSKKSARMSVPTPVKALEQPVKRSLTPRPRSASGRLRAVDPRAELRTPAHGGDAVKRRHSEARREAIRPSSPKNLAVPAPPPSPSIDRLRELDRIARSPAVEAPRTYDAPPTPRAPEPPPRSPEPPPRSPEPPPRTQEAPLRPSSIPPSAPPRTPSAPPPTQSAIDLDRAAAARAPAKPFVPTPQLSRLLLAAREANASDLHLVAGRPPLFRVAADLVPKGEPLGRNVVDELLKPAIPPRLQAAFDQKGSCDFALDLPRLGRFRVNLSKQRTGLKACFRVIPIEVPTIESLGLPPELAKALDHHQGLIVITGPSGHGKTTTLAALVDRLVTTRAHHVITVEDPIEHVHARKRALLSQREVGTHTRSFLTALKASLREDPDVIVVGELRDRETVRMALSASETGHLVLGTMSTPSAARTIDRLIDLFPPDEQAQVRTTLAGGLRMIVSQRLLPSASRTERHAAIELLPGSIALWNLIRENKTFQISSLMQRGKGAGILRLADSLAELVRAGKVLKSDAALLADGADLDEPAKGAVPDPPPSRPGEPKPPPGSSPERKPPASVAEPPPTPREPELGEEEKKGLFDRLFRKGR